MAEDILVASAHDIVKRLISLGIDEIGLIRGVEKEVKKLGSILGEIQRVLQEAEKKQVEDKRVRRWLEKLKEAALDAEDILDEFACDGLRREVVARPKVTKFFSCFSSLALHSKTAHSIRNINKRLQDIDKEKNMF
ncbi:hypothetical protein Syun_030554 [Stephania yunnanensis]|uniref:Disease resistance N-terminal domain-containing protein n=1 Tax=Stephania yunnanensis TaxID=152371 RepID=A0AAP0DU63_9MAGN